MTEQDLLADYGLSAEDLVLLSDYAYPRGDPRCPEQTDRATAVRLGLARSHLRSLADSIEG